MTTPDSLQIFGTVCFALAVLHTFSVGYFKKLGNKYPDGSVGENFFHLIGEIEVVFGIWAALFLAFYWFARGGDQALTYLETRHFTEPFFVFVIMSVCGSKPILTLSDQALSSLARFFKFKGLTPFLASALVVGPLLGSLITEPAAMTIAALLLSRRIFNLPLSEPLKYGILGTLFVNISIGGTLTPFAAPPVLMVARVWEWDLAFMLSHFGYKASIAVILNTLVLCFTYRRELSHSPLQAVPKVDRKYRIPMWVGLLHILILIAVILSSHHMVLYGGLFLVFLGITQVTAEYQETLKLREGLLVTFFLGGLVILGSPQEWWLRPVITNLSHQFLFFASMVCTAITDNAAITYLGSQVEQLSENSRYALVAGSVVGGGLTVIANAPNPVGYTILNQFFGASGIKAIKLLKSALIPTTVAALCFWFL